MRARDPEKQQRIKEATVRLILREGIEGASVAKIAKEADVSPATIYIYYTNKDEMLSEVFREYAHRSYRSLLDGVRPDMGGAELIDTLIRGYFAYSTENEEAFSFVEQCSRCPSLAEQATETECCHEVFELLHGYQSRGAIRMCSDTNLAAVLFAPVRFLAMQPDCGDKLDELIAMLQTLLAYT